MKLYVTCGMCIDAVLCCASMICVSYKSWSRSEAILATPLTHEHGACLLAGLRMREMLPTSSQKGLSRVGHELVSSGLSWPTLDKPFCA